MVATIHALHILCVEVEIFQVFLSLVEMISSLVQDIVLVPLVYIPGKFIAKDHVDDNVFIAINLLSATLNRVSDRHIAKHATIDQDHVIDSLRLKSEWY